MSSHHYQTFLFEVGVEEIPSRFLDAMTEEFGQIMERALSEARLEHHDVKVYSTPRRLIFQSAVAPRQTEESETVRGPAVSVAWQDDRPTRALEGFLGRVGLSVDQLGRQMVGDREYVTALVTKPTASAAETLPGVTAKALAGLPQPRSMRWNNSDARFIRPVRWLLLVLDDAVLQAEAMGVVSGQVTYGNRTDHPEPLAVASVDAYWKALEEGWVEPNGSRRRDTIVRGARPLAQQAGGAAELDPELLSEVANLVEWPTPFLGAFEPEFLAVPEPILVTSMRVHQRYFPVRDEEGKLRPNFLAVRNGVGQDLDQVRRGNQKVLRARLSDARYFYEIDTRSRLADRLPDLEKVTLHAKLGSYQDKIDRVKALFQATRSWWGLDESLAKDFERSVDLYKCDLLTQVVGEFPELQGEMGGIYAARDGEPAAVVEAIRDQYRPSSGKDALPVSQVAQVLGMLDRVDTLMAFYGAKIRASGSEDPYGLRRAALGVARLAVETPVLHDHTMEDLLKAAQVVIQSDAQVVDDVVLLIRTRLESQLADVWAPDVLDAVLAKEFPWRELVPRLGFVEAHRTKAEDVVAAHKRVTRIVRGSKDAQEAESYTGIEHELGQAADRALSSSLSLEGWWTEVQALAPVVNQFFDEVLVMDPDPAVRRARLGLLAKVQEALGRFVDWDRLKGGTDG